MQTEKNQLKKERAILVQLCFDYVADSVNIAGKIKHRETYKKTASSRNVSRLSALTSAEGAVMFNLSANTDLLEIKMANSKQMVRAIARRR